MKLSKIILIYFKVLVNIFHEQKSDKMKSKDA